MLIASVRFFALLFFFGLLAFEEILNRQAGQLQPIRVTKKGPTKKRKKSTSALRFTIKKSESHSGKVFLMSCPVQLTAEELF